MMPTSVSRSTRSSQKATLGKAQLRRDSDSRKKLFCLTMRDLELILPQKYSEKERLSARLL